MTKNHLYLTGIKRKKELEKKLKNRKVIKHTTKSGEKWKSEIEERIAIPQTGEKDKVLVLEKVRHPKGAIEFRVGYWIIAGRGKAKNKWWWGQFAPFIPPKDLTKLIKARKKFGMGF